MQKLALYDLLAPQFLLGFSFPDYIDRNLSILSVEELHTTYDNDLIIYSGTLMVGGDGTGGTDFVQENPSGSSFAWNGNQFKFRLTISRDGADLMHDSINPTTDATLTSLNTLFGALRSSDEATSDPVGNPHTSSARDETITDYPGFAFKLELLLDVLNFSLPSVFVPGKIDPVSRHVKPDNSPEYVNERVKIILPKVVLQYKQAQDLSEDPEFDIVSWGGSGLDTPHDLNVGEFVRMDPPIALHTSGNVAFSLDRVILDNSVETTPPEILSHFGTSEDFKGFYIGQFLIFVINDQGIGANFSVHDALFSYDGDVSFEAALDVFINKELTWLSVDVKIYTGAESQDFTRGEIDVPSSPPTVTSPSSPPGRATVKEGSVLQVEISGGTPPYNVKVFRDTTDVWDASARQVVLDTIGSDQRYLVYVEDSGAERRKYAEYLSITVQPMENEVPAGGTGTPADQPADPRRRPAVLAPVSGGDAGHTVRHRDARTGTVETIEVPGNQPAVVTVTPPGPATPLTTSLTETNRTTSFNLPHGSTYNIEVDYPAGPVPPSEITITFNFKKPLTSSELQLYLDDVNLITVVDPLSENPSIRVPDASESRSGDTQFLSEITRLNDWIRSSAGITGVVVDGFASLNSASFGNDVTLSHHRKQVGDAILAKLGISGVTGTGANGHNNFNGAGTTNGPERDFRAVRMRASFQAAAGQTITTSIARPALPPAEVNNPPQQDPVPTPPAPQQPSAMPAVLRRLGVRVRLERNRLVLLEFSGEIDFETEMEKRIRADQASPSATDSLALTNAGGNNNPEDGVVDFKLLYSYNTATSEHGIGLTLGSHPEDTDGLLHMNNPGGTGSNPFKNIFGAVLVFAPIINAAAVSTAEDSESAGNWIALGASVAVPVAIGGLGIFRTRRAILYGGEVKVKFSQPEAGTPRSVDVGVVFDYGVEFDIVVESLGIGADRNVPNPTAPPMKVRYKAIGFNIHYDSVDDEVKYSAVFDASRGYDLQLSDPSLFSLPAPLGNLFGISAARLARFNPLTLEIDMAIKVDLGIITVDKFKIKIPLDGEGNVQILPSGVKVNIPGTLVGNGFVNIVDTLVTQADGSQIEAKGIEGGLDLTIVPVKLRVAGNVAVTQLRDTATGREGVGIFVSLTVEFPSPIVLGASGLGLYGVMGLFAMHYRRLESTSVPPTDPIGPALKWLITAEGDPTKLRNSSNTALWGPNFDRWSFGVGVILGTMDTGFTANFQGMFILELPGPRILIMVKMKFVSVKPEGVDDDYNQITTGIIAVIDIDFEQEKITIGVLIDFEIEEILQLKIPIEILFKLKDPSYWHFWLGTFTVPVSANILNMVRGSAYFMIQGHELTFPSSMSNVPAGAQILGRTLTPVAIALGLEASLVFGSESVGLYLKIGAGFHVGLSFSPFVIVGAMFFAGELRLFIVSIGARGTIDVLITKKEGEPFYIYMHGEVCGKVDFFFFSISACIDITIEEGVKAVEPPALLTGVYLQSYAPVLVSGQGGDKPIDASLGNAAEGVTTSGLPVVPIDTVVVMQMSYSPLTTATSAPFADPILTSPDIRPGGWVHLSEETKVKYDITSIRLEESGGTPYADPDKVPATWRVERNSGETLTNGARTNVDLALFSRVPATADRALERSSDLEKQIEVTWGNVCHPAAPPASVLFTFCGQLLGPSPSGWDLNGIAKPDPPDTLRMAPPDTAMHVRDYNPEGASSWDLLAQQLGISYTVPSRVVGGDRFQQESGNQEKPVCVSFKAGIKGIYELMRHGVYVVSGNKVADLKESVFEEARILDPVERENIRMNSLGSRLTSVINKRSFLIKSSRFRIPVISPDDMPPVVPATWKKPMTDHAALIDTMKGNVGIVLEPKLAIHFRKPVCKVEITIIPYSPKGKVALTGYDNRKKVVSKAALKLDIRKVAIPMVITMSGRDMTSLAVNAARVKGLIVKICFYTDCDDSGKPMNGKCHKALQLPYCNVLSDKLAREIFNSDEELLKALKKYEQTRQCNAFLDLDTGACEELKFMAAVRRNDLGTIRVQELDESGTVLQDHQLSSLSPQLVSNVMTDLPADWINPSLPWRTQVLPVTQFLFSTRFQAFAKFTFHLKPDSACVKIRFATGAAKGTLPAMYLGIVERLQLSEIVHHDTVTASGTSSLASLEGYLSHSEGDRPLLKPDKVYHLHVDYEATVETNGTPATTSHTQSFSFKTDNEAPPELKPYILGTTPGQEDEYHFFRDPLKVVFNDTSTLEMFREYGKELMGVIRGADGDAVTNSPDSISSLDPVPASVLTPYRELVEALIDAGLLDCAGGFVHINHHGVYECPFELKPLMGYTFDIELDPPDTVATGESRVPLFRRSFRTSRFGDLEEFADAVSILPVYSMALTGPVSGLPAPGPVPGTTRTDIGIIKDIDLQHALENAGIPPASGAEDMGIWILWRQQGSAFRPYALLIDAAEPMWRLRSEPVKATVKDGTDNVIDPQFIIWEQGERLSLELLEDAGIVDYFIRSAGGTRCLVMLNPSALSTTGSTTLSIDIRQPASDFYGLTEKKETLLTITLDLNPPWED